jgi:hypothetical protein
MKRITSAELIASLQAANVQQPTETIVVTHDGKDLFVVLKLEDYVSLTGNDRDGMDDLQIPDTDLDTIEWNR